MVAEDIYALKNLLPAGVVQLYFESDAIIKPPVAESDNWNSLTPFMNTHKLRAIASSQTRIHDLDFLVSHRFLRATWRVAICDGVILVHVCVYLIPYDLPGAHGHLLAHNRDRQKLMLHGRKILFSLLSNTNRSTAAWVRCPVSHNDYEPFLSQQPVSCLCFERNFSNVARAPGSSHTIRNIQ